MRVICVVTMLYPDALFPEAIEANKSRMDDVIKKVDQVRGMTSGVGASASGQTGSVDGGER